MASAGGTFTAARAGARAESPPITTPKARPTTGVTGDSPVTVSGIDSAAV